MTIDSYDNIYISRYNADNSGNYYVLKVLPNGTSVILGNTGKNPIGIAVSSTGTVYVANNSFGTIAQTEYLTII
jgi:DNA-binding beta-propeller fold protein YncE